MIYGARLLLPVRHGSQQRTVTAIRWSPYRLLLFTTGLLLLIPCPGPVTDQPSTLIRIIETLLHILIEPRSASDCERSTWVSILQNIKFNFSPSRHLLIQDQMVALWLTSTSDHSAPHIRYLLLYIKLVANKNPMICSSVKCEPLWW